MTTSIEVRESCLQERDAQGNGGTMFPYGYAVRFPCDEHRRNYSHTDAIAVAEMVNGSSWITREGR